jgi:endo-1,4-beta-xylanase
MINRNLITNFFLILVIAISAYGQDNTQKASQRTLKEAYGGKFLIGAANDLTKISEAEAEHIKMQYDIITPENCMKPQPIHPSEDKYNFVTSDAMVGWCQKNGLKVWGHTLAWHSQSPQWFFQGKNPAENYQKQAEVYKVYKKLFEIFMRHSDVINRVTFWALAIQGHGAEGRMHFYLMAS